MGSREESARGGGRLPEFKCLFHLFTYRIIVVVVVVVVVIIIK